MAHKPTDAYCAYQHTNMFQNWTRFTSYFLKEIFERFDVDKDGYWNYQEYSNCLLTQYEPGDETGVRWCYDNE